MTCFKVFVYTYIFPVFYAFGLIGCLLNCITLNGPKFSTRTFTYLRAIAFSDICFIAIHIPFMKYLASQEAKPLAEIAQAKSNMTYHIFVEEPLINAVWSVSGLMILCMTIDRYFAVCKPIEYQKERKYLNARIGNVQFFANLIFILYARWRLKIVCLQTKLASLAICKKSNFHRFLTSVFH